MRHILLALLIAAPASAQNADAVWQSLMDGNRAFVAGKVTFDHLADLRKHSADHQNPPVTILSCSDSRVPPELIFNRSLDQLFVIRVAGNVAADFETASIEYAIANGYTNLIVVLAPQFSWPRASAEYLLAKSKVIREAVGSKRVGLVVAYYHLDSGAVERLR